MISTHAYNELFRTVSSMDTVNLMNSLMLRDPVTYQHSVRVALLAEKFADQLKLTEAGRRQFTRGCFLHDVGKLLIPEQILMKCGKLNSWEWGEMKKHTLYGEGLLSHEFQSDSEVMNIVRYHHERYDGLGYPYGLAGDNIPLLARACSIIDAFDAMAYGRAYQTRKSLSDIWHELERNAGTQFDSDLLLQFLEAAPRLLYLYPHTN
ncbi:HD domain-containing protein [Paenibacillus sp. J5C_2022]|uniref:HD-GYP domain-containing protein n=1 Tax=Paenibacillus sp. J5C2022 TaxID=2977129 RepID=UPI0021D34BD1|nr:HD domain-containing phosphohydrolase [Paenibacillus sp. J5C2022]MCU6711633.1 HD domain-containing protein [Paenibacillus sp. J5C2022]